MIAGVVYEDRNADGLPVTEICNGAGKALLIVVVCTAPLLTVRVKPCAS